MKVSPQMGKRSRSAISPNGLALLLSLRRGLGLALMVATLASLPGVVARPESASAQTRLARLQKYSFNPTLNRLDIYTSAGVHPRASVLESGDRLRVVIDLPQTAWHAPKRQQSYTGTVRSLRIGQFNPQTTRLVLDLAPGTKLSDRDIALERTGATTWAISVSPQQTDALPRKAPPPLLDPRALLSRPSSTRPSASRPSNPTRVLGIHETAEGFFIRTNRRPQVNTRLLSAPSRVAIDLIDGDVAGLFGAKTHAINRHGVRSLRFSQWQPNVARIVLDVAPSSTRWSIDYDADRGGLRIYPQARTALRRSPSGRAIADRPSADLCDRLPRPRTLAELPQEAPTELAYPLASAAPISSGLGYRTHPVTGRRSFHAGVDLAAPNGTPILAALSGEVTFAGARGNLGNAIILDHGYNYRTRYGHMLRVFVRTGDRVRQGQLIGYVGSTGRSTGPHLHFEYLRQKPDGSWLALDPQAQIVAATPSGTVPPVTATTGLAIGGGGLCDRP
ncbi:MAG: peptidoglycan DD-metalloendopeptidase family protein [Cyanobacteria bacterium J06639_1]